MNAAHRADGIRRRAVPALVLMAGAAVLGLASWLEASPDGLGTHTQLGLSACGFHQRLGLPCATCGMTTAFSHAADGRLFRALVTQPAGAVLSVLTAVAVLVSAYAVVTGMPLEPVLGWLLRPTAVVLLAVLVLGSWGYKALMLHLAG